MDLLLDVVIALLSAALGLWLGRRWQAHDERYPLRIRASWVRPKRAREMGLTENHLDITIKNRGSRTVRIGRITFKTDTVDDRTTEIECALPEEALSLEIEQAEKGEHRLWLFAVGSKLSARCATEMGPAAEKLRTQVNGRVAVGRICAYDHDTKKSASSGRMRLLLRASDRPTAGKPPAGA